MKFSASLLILSLAAAASASSLHVPRRGGQRGRFGAGGNHKGFTASSSVAASSAAASVAKVSSVAASQSAAASATAVGTAAAASGSAAATGVSSAAVASSSAAATGATSVASSAAATSTAAAGDNGAAGNAASGADAQSSLTLLNSVIATGFENDGQAVPEAGQVASLTSSNNFINFCATEPGKPLTNGLQIVTGSCNPAPMGVIAAFTNMPSSKFVFPANGATVPANKDFTIQMAVKNLLTGNFVNAGENYFSAPQQIDAASGNIKGHSHVVIEALPSLGSTAPTDPTRFAFFKGLNAPANAAGILTADVPNGLPAGSYRIASINTAANHQPALVAVAQHGALDDMAYPIITPDAHHHPHHPRFASSFTVA
ncbi:hypothetical protein GSI_03328 [Ganoderma sinense ZZ0214-1]|uniref:Uncharacterized protein n=1 Tax=Ganoderma sinense ZZ0214-1 TaxID=1077348 RepID=A0A2G8SLD1_9APHY|nr:hypothetical protein GSI_03328 [Ganoderma sinense ZZ0214-1]